MSKRRDHTLPTNSTIVLMYKLTVCSNDGDDVEENVVHGRAAWKSNRRLLNCLDTPY